MPIDPFAALNAMLRAEAVRSTPPPRREPSTREMPAHETPGAGPAEPEKAAVRGPASED